MKKLLLPFILVFSLLITTSCEKNEEILSLDDYNSTILTKSEIEQMNCGESKAVPLIAGQNINVGSVTISNNEDNLYVVYETSGDWNIIEAHLYVGPESDIPLNNAGNPVIGHFPYHSSNDFEAGKSYIFTIPMANLDECFAVVTHAVVNMYDGQKVQEETAFGCGDKEFPGKRWGCYTDYCKQECSDECMNIYGYKKSNPEHSYCHTFADDDGQANIGWSNQFNYYYLRNKSYSFPLYANVGQCDPTTDPDGFEIGTITISFFSEGEGELRKLYTSVKYEIIEGYAMSEANLYLGVDEYPYDDEGNFISTEKNKIYSAELDNVTEYTFEKLNWPGSYQAWDGYVISHAKVCKVRN